MAWLELSITIDANQQQRLESALEDLGALAVTLSDADVDTPDERAIFEPGVGETPLWKGVVVQALFEANTDRAGLIDALIEFIPEFSPDQFAFRDVDDQDWTRAWIDTFQPMRFGRRLWIYPWHIEPPDSVDDVIVRLDPGLAFGTGTHPTTSLCLQWLDSLDLRGKTMIDFGCGSGVLAIAALKLGAARVIGVDNDEQAIVASRDNAQRNGVSEKLDLYTPDAFEPAPADVLVANILAGPLSDLAPVFANCVKSGGVFAISGILDGQQDELVARYGAWFDSLSVAVQDGWVRISGTRTER
ncbi:MAG: 50S ribosomal protein L11 methyltransferase [Rudaea sp.]